MEASTRPGKSARTASRAISCRTLKISHPRPPRCLRSLQNRQRRPHKHQTLKPASPTFRASFRNRTATAANLARNTTAAVRLPRRVQNQLHSAVERRRLRENFRTSQRTATDSPALGQVSPRDARWVAVQNRFQEQPIVGKLSYPHHLHVRATNL